MRILFLHEVNYLTKPIFEMHEFPEHLAKLGHEVGFVQFPEGLSKAQIRSLGWRKRIEGRAVEGVHLDLFTPFALSGSLFGRLLATIPFFWQFKRVIRCFKPDVIVCLSVPTSGWQALMAAKVTGVPFVFRALDVSHKIRRGLFSVLVKQAERFIYKNADHVSANNPAMRLYCSAMGAAPESVSVHYPPLDLTMFISGSRSKGRRRLGVPDDAHLSVYLGSFFYFSGLDAVLRAWSETKSEGTLALIGFGDQDKTLRALVEKLGLGDRVLFTGAVVFTQIPDLLAAADLGINPMKRSLVSDTALPNKVLQYLAAGLPVASTALDGLVSTFDTWPGVTWLDTPHEVGTFAAHAFQGNARLRHNHLNKLDATFGSAAIESFERFLSEVIRASK